MADRRPRIGRRALLRHGLLLSAIAAALLSFGAVSGFAADKSVETAGSAGTYHWQPGATEISTGGSVEFKNSQAIPHGVVFEAPPAAPGCTGVPSAGSSNWSGSCTFAEAGTYKFYCPVHPLEMKGTITVDGPSGPSAPVVTTEAATAIDDSGATLNGRVNPSEQETTYWFKWGTSSSYGQETAHESAGSGNIAIARSAALATLTPSTTYHFKLVAENATGTTEGTDRSFTTAGPPAVTTEAAGGVGSVQATLKGHVNPMGLGTEYFFEYGTSAAYDRQTAVKSAAAGTASLAVSQLVTGLTPETTYHFTLIARNGAGEVEAADRTFETNGGPQATTGGAGGVTESGATVEGTVNPQGQPTSYFFNYGTSTAYGLKTVEKSAGSGSGDAPVSEQLAGLSPGTTYHFQVVAKNASGTSAGEDGTFTTAQAPPPPPPTATTVPPVIDVPPAIVPPQTKITLKPPAKTHAAKVKIRFAATAARASFRCSVDSKRFRPCRSPFTTPKLRPGKHRIRVVAVAGGLTDPTPASIGFKVLAGRSRRGR
jgi:plastocyanin